MQPDPIPADYPVQPLDDAGAAEARDPVTCGACGLTWDDGRVTSMTPTPAGRCPFEAFHAEGPEPEGEPYGITFSGDAGETFEKFCDLLAGYTVEVRTVEGEEFSATMVGHDADADWYDAVKLRRYDETGRFEGEEVTSHRVARLHVV